MIAKGNDMVGEGQPGSFAELEKTPADVELEARLEHEWNRAPATDRARAMREAEAFIQQYHKEKAQGSGLKPSSLAESASKVDLTAELKEARRAIEEDRAWKAQLDAMIEAKI